MKRQLIILKSSTDYGSPLKRHICIDLLNQEEIYSCIKNKRKKFWYIVERTLTQKHLYWDSYDKEEVNSKTINTSAIKFFDADNARIYCKEMKGIEGNFFIVCAIVLFQKKVQKNNTTIINILETISKYEYETT